MASINISEEDFTVLAFAAMDAKDRGDMDAATALDKLARKANAALTNAQCSAMRRQLGSAGKSMTWQQVPSTLYDVK